MLVTAPNNLLVGAEFSGGMGSSYFKGQLAYMAYAFSLYLVPAEDAPGKKRPGAEEEGHRGRVRGRDEGWRRTRTRRRSRPSRHRSTRARRASHAEDRKYVTKAQWNEWVPDNPEDPPLVPAGSVPPRADRHEIRNMVRLPVFPVKTNAPRQFQVRLAHPWFEKPQTMPLPKDPGDDAGRKKAVKAWLQGRRSTPRSIRTRRTSAAATRRWTNSWRAGTGSSPTTRSRSS